MVVILRRLREAQAPIRAALAPTAALLRDMERRRQQLLDRHALAMMERLAWPWHDPEAEALQAEIAALQQALLPADSALRWSTSPAGSRTPDGRQTARVARLVA